MAGSIKYISAQPYRTGESAEKYSRREAIKLGVKIISSVVAGIFLITDRFRRNISSACTINKDNYTTGLTHLTKCFSKLAFDRLILIRKVIILLES